MTFVIAYDIAHPRRLRQVARRLEKQAVRCQYSVFLFEGTEVRLQELLDELATLIRPDQDVIQAWPVPAGTSPADYARGAVRPTRPAAVIVAGRRALLVDPSLPNPNPLGPSEELR